MNKSEVLELLQIVGSAILIYGSKYFSKAKKIYDDFEDLKKKQFLMEQSLKKAWENIDKIKNVSPMEGKFNPKE